MATRDHRILLISPMVPAAAGNGLAMRCGMFLEALHQVGRVDVLTVPFSAYRDTDAVAYSSPLCGKLMQVETTGRRDTLLEMIIRTSDEDERLNKFARYGRPFVCGHLSATVIREACDLVAGRSYDMTVMVRNHNGPCLASIRRKTGTGRCLIDFDDDDAALHAQLAAKHRARGQEIEARWNELEATAFDRLTAENAKLAHATSVSNPLQAEALSQRIGIKRPVVIPNSISMNKPQDPTADPTMIMVGTLNYEPNADAVTWFFNNVFPAIRTKIPDARLVVAGRSPPRHIRHMGAHDAVTVIGDPPDLDPLYRSSMLAVIPLLSGSGTRIKALEAAAFGLPLVSTATGVDGLGLRHGEHAWITSADPGAFAAACIDALISADKRKIRAKRLRRYVTQRYERAIVIRQIANLVLEQLQPGQDQKEAPES